MTTAAGAAAAAADLRFVRGAPDETEIAAAAVVLLLALRAGGAAAPAGHRPRAAHWRTEDYRAPGAWSSLP